jgi:hypothetical protein
MVKNTTANGVAAEMTSKMCRECSMIDPEPSEKCPATDTEHDLSISLTVKETRRERGRRIDNRNRYLSSPYGGTWR